MKERSSESPWINFSPICGSKVECKECLYSIKTHGTDNLKTRAVYAFSWRPKSHRNTFNKIILWAFVYREVKDKDSVEWVLTSPLREVLRPAQPCFYVKSMYTLCKLEQWKIRGKRAAVFSFISWILTKAADSGKKKLRAISKLPRAAVALEFR